MKSNAVFRVLACATAITFAPIAHARDDEEQETIVATALPDGAARGLGVPIFPLEEILDQLRRSRGFAFIFDSRLVAGKSIRAVDPAGSAERVLQSELEAINLRLHKMGSGTYAITEAPQDTESEPALVIDRLAPQEPNFDTILVMGTAQVDGAAAGSKRLFQIDADDLAFLNVTSPAEAIYDLPQSLASFTPANTALLGATAGISLADLRGLDPKRTLVLVNGRRRALTTGGNGDIGGVDLNSIAEPFLERIEVQSLPGGARRGPSAVAGTVNFVTRSSFEGVEAGLQAGIAERGDREQFALHALAGRTFDSVGNLTVGLAATRVEGLIGADREASAAPYGFALNGIRAPTGVGMFLPGFGGSSTTDRGAFSGVVLADGDVVGLPIATSLIPNSDGSLSPFVGRLDQLYNWAAEQSLTLPNDRLLGILSFNSDRSDGWRVFAEAQAAVSATDNRLAPLPTSRYRGVDRATGDAAVIPLDNPTLPQSIRDLVAANFGVSAAAVIFDHRYAELGPRRDSIDRLSIDIAVGVEREDPRLGSFNLAYRRSTNRVVTRYFDRIDLGRLRTALDHVECAATPGCALVDYFSTPSISGEALAFITIPEFKRITSIAEHEISAAYAKDLSFGQSHGGEFWSTFTLRRETIEDRDLAPHGVQPLSTLPSTDNRGSVDTIEGGVGFDARLASADPLPGEIDGSLAYRTTKSSETDFATNFEASVDWRPIDGLSIFARRHIGERTPNIIELHNQNGSLEMLFADPCDAADAAEQPIVAQNCASSGPLGVGPGFRQTSILAANAIYGNPDLEPEKVRTAAYGLSFSPHDLIFGFPGKLNVSASWLDYEIDDAIDATDQPLSVCYSSLDFSSPTCGVNPRTGASSIERDPVTRQVVRFDSLLVNGGDLRWRGLDLEMRYAFEPDRFNSIEKVWASVLHTYTDTVERTNVAGERHDLTGLVDHPRHRTLISAGVEAGPWSLVAFANRRGRAVTARIDRPEARIPAALYLDLTARFNVSDQAYVQAGVQNVTDEEPAITAFNEIPNFAPEYYDPVGRRYSISVRLNF